jgi:NADPH:quinone reductase-like Zn-dependent oxidoreductase
VQAASVGRYPRALDARHAGAAAVTALAALQGIDDHLRVRRGQTVLVFGASGAVGTLAVQFARQRGARVLATATGRKARAVVESLGATGIVDARRPDLAEQLRTLAPEGLNAVLALAGGEALERSLHAVVRGGRVAYPNGAEPEPRGRRTFRRIGYDAETGARAWSRLERASAAARLRVILDSIYSLARAADAHARVEKGHVVGRVAIRIRRRR